MNLEQPCIRISVRNLVEFILRHGNIDNRTGGADKDAMQQGSRIHRKIQRQMGAEYRAEVALKYEVPCENFVLSVEGRADGIIELPKRVVVDEIKGVFKDLKRLEEPQLLHLAQAKCYAYIYAEQKDLDEIGVQMTYCNLDTEEIKRFQQLYTKEELKIWFKELVSEYEKWARYQMEWRKKRNASIKSIEFPFDYREGQRNLVASVYRTILRKKKLFIQAPTGVGKTMATVFPAVKAVGEELGEKIFYLTAKTITRTVASQAFEILREQNLRMKEITLTAKEKICFCDEVVCNPDACPYAKGHFDRVNDAVYELITTTDHMSREILEAQAEKWKVCPFEMALDVSQWVDAVICDYNYVFDPNAHLKRFFGDGVKGEYLFLIDEAHNLVERGRTMYSTSICKEDFLKIKRLVKAGEPKLESSLESCNKLLLALKRECDGCQILNSVSHIYVKLLTLMTELEEYLEDCKDEAVRKEVLEFYFQIRNFLYIHERLDENYLIYSELDEAGNFYIHLFCVNPAACLQEYMDKGNSTILFSATFLPINYYKKLLSTAKDDYAIYAESPFEQKKRLLLLGNDVSTKYARRGPEMYQKYASYIRKITMAKSGNYIAFFPSYRFMEDVYEEFCNQSDVQEKESMSNGWTKTDTTGGYVTGEIEVLVQSQYMTEQEREEFLERFEIVKDHSLIGFCVMGGIFSEGIDLTEDKLIGAMIIGTGLPQVCLERELLKYYFDNQGLNGFDYAYLYPGMNKVLQSAGRVIRTDQDRGVIVLLDDRFMERQCQNVFPREWEDYKVCNSEGIRGELKRFWSEDVGV